MTTPEKTAESVVHSVVEHAREYADAGKQALHSASNKARQLGSSADHCVRENPWIAIGIAAGLGALAAVLLTSRRKH